MFRKHFSEQLGGAPSTFARSHSSTLDSLTGLVSKISGIGASSVVPGLSSLAKSFRCASLGAGGEDRIRGVLCRRFPRVFACLYFPLIFKSACLLSPPPCSGVVAFFKSCSKIRAPPFFLVSVANLGLHVFVRRVSRVVLGWVGSR